MTRKELILTLLTLVLSLVAAGNIFLTGWFNAAALAMTIIGLMGVGLSLVSLLNALLGYLSRSRTANTPRRTANTPRGTTNTLSTPSRTATPDDPNYHSS